MLRLSLTLLTILGLASCDCESGPTGSHAFVQNFIVSESPRQPSRTSLKRFQSSLKRLSFEELIELTDLIHQTPDSSFKETSSTDVLAQEIWNRNPDLLGFHSALGGLGEDGRFNNQFLTMIAKTDPEGGWKMMSAYYLADYRAGNSGFTHGTAMPFFEGLQMHHPDKARLFFKEVAEQPQFETGNLKIQAYSGILNGIKTPAEAISLMTWLREEKIEQRPIGSHATWDSDFLKISPGDMEIQTTLANALIMLAEISPTAAEEWIVKNDEAGSLPRSWARAYLRGAKRSENHSLEAASQFIARVSKPGDGTLENLLEESIFEVPPTERQKLFKIQAETKR
ncbi:hypothetical protein N9Y81_01885 [Akkermansiaceae bacterium]|jgi:hypothetical protein|nr:hypothetical protein [Akkermansiaceae bacterium]